MPAAEAAAGNRRAPVPAAIPVLRGEAERLGFTQSCAAQTGALLRMLAASKPSGRILELGTGVGQSAAWILDGMDRHSRLTSVDARRAHVEVARRVLGADRRVTFVNRDGAAFLDECAETFDLIFADAWPGKFTRRGRAIALLRPGGLYAVDDLTPRPDWPDGREAEVERLTADLESAAGLHAFRTADATGLLVACRAV